MIDIKKGICYLCNNTDGVVNLGPNGEDVCFDCGMLDRVGIVAKALESEGIDKETARSRAMRLENSGLLEDAEYLARVETGRLKSKTSTTTMRNQFDQTTGH